jgi:hypothetical protein
MGVGSYVKFPDMWRHVLRERRASLADWKIAIELLAMARFAEVVKLTNAKVADLGFGPATRRRSLKRLAKWSLIRLEPRPGKTPLVRVKWLAGRQPGGHGK